MTEKYLDYDENLFLNIGANMEYQRAYGILRRERLLKIYIFYFALAVAATVAVGVFSKNVLATVIAAVISIAWEVYMCFITKKTAEKKIRNFVTSRYNSNPTPHSKTRLTVGEKGFEVKTPYLRSYYPYSDIDVVLSTSIYFYIKIRDCESVYTIPKKNKDIKAIWYLEVTLKSAVGDRYKEIKVRGDKIV